MTLKESTEEKTLGLTTAAAEAVKELLEKRNLEGYGLRVYIQGGGCSGFQYGMALDNNIREQDIVVEEHGVQVIVDEVSIGYMQGASIDYVENSMGSGFKIDNPNSLGSCGCGSSTDNAQYGCSGCG